MMRDKLRTYTANEMRGNNEIHLQNLVLNFNKRKQETNNGRLESNFLPPIAYLF